MFQSGNKNNVGCCDRSVIKKCLMFKFAKTLKKVASSPLVSFCSVSFLFSPGIEYFDEVGQGGTRMQKDDQCRGSLLGPNSWIPGLQKNFKHLLVCTFCDRLYLIYSFQDPASSHRLLPSLISLELQSPTVLLVYFSTAPHT